MSTLAGDMSFDFTYPYSSVEQPSTPSPPMPSMDFSLDPSFLALGLSSVYHSPYATLKPEKPSHTRSSSRGSIYSGISTVESTPDSVCTRLTTPPRESPPVHQHGPLLLPKIRSQDQDVDATPQAHRRQQPQAALDSAKLTPKSARKATRKTTPRSRVARSNHVRSYTSPETLTGMAYAHLSFSTPRQAADLSAGDLSSSLLCSPASFAPGSAMPSSSAGGHARRCSSVDPAAIDKYGYPTYRQMPLVQHDLSFPSAYAAQLSSSLLPAGVDATPPGLTPEPVDSTTLLDFLTASNPAASLVRTVSFPHRDPTIKHFWWDIRSVSPWSSFNAAAILALPGASSFLTTPVPAPALPQLSMPARHPETEAALHAIYTTYYLPKINAALGLASSRPLQLSAPPARAKDRGGPSDLLFVANPAGESSTAASMFGGKPSARVVGLVRTFDRFNTGMRAEGNIKRVEYLRGLAALHHAMREHGCRYGFIITEIELVVARNGIEDTPFFGDMETTSVQLAASAPEDGNLGDDPGAAPLTACLALWGLCQLAAGDKPQPGHACWRTHIGAPAEGTRRKARARDSWMPTPQLAEKREAKRSRGWVWPEDAVGRKELGKRGVRYNGI